MPKKNQDAAESRAAVRSFNEITRLVSGYDDEDQLSLKSFDRMFTGETGAADGYWNPDVQLEMSAQTLKNLFYTEAWVYICVNLVAKKISTQPLKVVQSIIKDNKVVIEDAPSHPMQAVVEYPNKWQSYHDWMYTIAADLCLTGNGFQWYGEETQVMVTIPAEGILPKISKDGELEGYYTVISQDMIAAGHKPVFFSPDEIMHFMNPNPNSLFWGTSAFSAGRRAVLFNRYTSEYLNNFYLKGATPSIVLELTQDANENNIARMLRSFEQAYTGRRNQRRPTVLPKGITAKMLNSTLSDQNLLAHIAENKNDIINLLSIPPHEVGLQKSGSLGSEEYKTALRNFWEATLKPMMAIISGTLTRRFAEQLGDGYSFEFDLSGVDALKDDELTKANLAEKMLATHTVNEVRAQLYNLPPHPDGDTIGKPVSAPAFGQIGLSMTTPAEKSLSPTIDTPETAKRLTMEQKAGRVASVIKAKKNDWDKREQALKDEFEKTNAKMVTFTADILFQQADAVVDLIERKLKEKEEKRLKTKAVEEPKSKAKLKADIKKALDELADKWVDGYGDKLTSSVDVGYNQSIKFGFNESDQNKIEAIGNAQSRKRRDILEARGLDTFANMNETTTSRVLDVIYDGVTNNKTIQEIAKEIYARFDAIETVSRAATIARTETLTATSMGQLAAIEDAKEVIPNLKKMWITADDDRVRDSHAELHGDIVDIDEAYDNGLMIPRDPTGDAGETINCRCDQIVLPADDMENIANQNSDIV